MYVNPCSNLFEYFKYALKRMIIQFNIQYTHHPVDMQPNIHTAHN